MEPKRELTKGLIASGLKELMLIQPFEKITIRMITERAGIIRPTFYYHFQDKYEVFEWIIQNDILKAMSPMLKKGMVDEALQLAFVCIYSEREFYSRAFDVAGQNSFTGMMIEQFTCFIRELMETRPLKVDPSAAFLDKDVLAQYTAYCFVSGIRMWIKELPETVDAAAAASACKYLIRHSFSEIIGGPLGDGQ